MSTDFFVSYCSQDYEQVMPLVDQLRSADVATWVDEGSIDNAHPDRDKFLMVVQETEVVTDDFNIVLNFDKLIEQRFAELKNNK